MPLATSHTFRIDGPMTVADLLDVAEQLRGADPAAEVRVLTRLGGLAGSHIRQINIMPPVRQRTGGGSS